MKRTKFEKQREVRLIIDKLTELKLTMIYEPIRELFKSLHTYVHADSSIRIDIEFPEIHKRIVGYLPIEKKNECVVKLENVR